MLKIDSKEKINMDKIKSHPWILKGYDTPLNNFLLPRTPLTIPLDMRVLKNMKGFGFGSPDEINNIIEQSISTGIVKETENFKFLNIIRKRNKKSLGGSFGNRSGSIKSLTRSFSNSSSISNSFSTDDEEQIKKHILPIVSIYYLVAEKLERIEKYKISMEMQNQTAALHHANQLNNYKNHDLKLSAEDILREGIIQNNDNTMTAVSNIKETVTPTVPATLDTNKTSKNTTTVVTVNTSSIDGNSHPSPVAAIMVESTTPPPTIDVEHRNENIKFEIANSSSEDSINHYTEHIGETLESKEDEFIKMDAEVILDSSIVDAVSTVANNSAQPHPLPQPDYNNYDSSSSRHHSRSGTNHTHSHLNIHSRSRTHSRNHSNSNSNSHYSTSETAIINNEVVDGLSPSKNNSNHTSPMSSKRSFSSPSPIKSIGSGSNKRKSSSHHSSISKSFKSDPHQSSLTMTPTSASGGSMNGVDEGSLKDKENIASAMNEKKPLKSIISKSKINKIFSSNSSKNNSAHSSIKESKSRKSSVNMEPLTTFPDIEQSKFNVPAVEHSVLPVPKVAARPRAISASMARPNIPLYQDPMDVPMAMSTHTSNANVRDLTRHSMVVQKEDSTVNEPSRRKSFSNLRRFSFAIGKTFSKNSSNNNNMPSPMPLDNSNSLNSISSASTNSMKGYSGYYVSNPGMPKVNSGELRDLRSSFNYNNRQNMYHPMSYEQLKLGHRRQPSQESASDISLTDMLTTSPFQFKVPLTLGRADQHIKNVNLKGLFSVNNTSTHNPTEIRQSIITTLIKFGLFYVEMTGSFQCEYTADYTLNTNNGNSAATTNSNSLFSVDGSSSFISNFSYGMDPESFNQEYEKAIHGNQSLVNGNAISTNGTTGGLTVQNNKIGRKIRSKSFANMFVSKLTKSSWKKSSNSNGSMTTIDGTTIINPSMSNMNSFSGGFSNINSQYTNTNSGQTFMVTSPDGNNKIVNKSKSMGNIKYNRKLDSHKLLKPHLKIGKSIRRSMRKKSKKIDVTIGSGNEGSSDESVEEGSQSLSENELTISNDKSSLNTNNSNSNSNSNASSKSNSLVHSTSILNLNLKKIRSKIKHKNKDKSMISDHSSIENIQEPSPSHSQAPSHSLSQSQSSFGINPSSTTSSQLLSPPASLQAFSSFTSTRENSNSSIILYDTDNMTSFIPVGNGGVRNSSSHHNLKYHQNGWQQDYIDMNKGLNTLSLAGEPSKASHLKRSITYCVPPHHKTSITKITTTANGKDGRKPVSSNGNISTISGNGISNLSNPTSTTTSHSRILSFPEQELYEDYSSLDSISHNSLTDAPSYITIEPPTPVVTPPPGANEGVVGVNNKTSDGKLLSNASMTNATAVSNLSNASSIGDGSTHTNGSVQILPVGIGHEDPGDVSILSAATLPANMFSTTNGPTNNGTVNIQHTMNGQGQGHINGHSVSPINTNLTSPTSNSNNNLKKLSPNSYANLNSILKQQQGTGNTIRFEIAIVRIPWLNLYGVQFRRISGNLWKYKKICTAILKELKL